MLFWKDKAFLTSINKFNERRINGGKTDSVGVLSHHGQGKGEERKKVNLDGFL
jgi:hypothetical protein